MNNIIDRLQTPKIISPVPSLQELDDYYGKLIELGKELGLPVLEPFIGVYYVNGKKREKIFFQHSESLVRNHYHWNIVNTIYIYDTSGTPGAGVLRHYATNGTIFNIVGYIRVPTTAKYGYTGDVNEAVNGIRVGYGDTAENFEHYSLVNPISHGVNLNELQHGTTVFAGGWDAGDSYRYANRERVFTNGGVNPCTVKESGMVMRCSAQYFMTMRDQTAWGTGQVIASGESLAVDYNLRFYF